MTIAVKHQPRKQIIIHEMMQFKTAAEMINIMTIAMPRGAVPPPLHWTHGILLTFTTVPITTENLAKERLIGNLHWDHVSFAPMPEYRSTIMGDNGISINVIDVSANETFDAAGKFLRKSIKK